MKNKVCLITGANSGIGKAAAIQILKEGWHVIIACRNRRRGEAALKEIIEISKSKAAELMIVDMSLQTSIRELAKSFMDKYDKLDVLIHNAAEFDIAMKKSIITKEGIESVWATNHLGPVLLTNLLLEHLKRSEQGRIITISSKGLLTFPFLEVDTVDPEFKHRKFSVTNAYYQAKLAQVMYTYWLAEKLEGTGVTANSIRVANVKIDIGRYPDISGLSKWMYSVKSKFSISPEEMAEVYTYLATSDEVGKISGKYFDEKKQMVKSSKYSYDKDSWEKLMNLTFKYLLP